MITSLSSVWGNVRRFDHIHEFTPRHQAPIAIPPSEAVPELGLAATPHHYAECRLSCIFSRHSKRGVVGQLRVLGVGPLNSHSCDDGGGHWRSQKKPGNKRFDLNLLDGELIRISGARIL